MNETKRTRICVPVCPKSVSELASLVARAAEVGDLVELRLDCLSASELARLQREIPALLRQSARPLILTLRPAEQGGRREIDNLTRLIFWTQFFSSPTGAEISADVELDIAHFFLESEKEGVFVLDWQRVICSHHDLTGRMVEPLKLYEQLSKTPAPVLKIAVQANEITDCLPLFQLLDRASREGRQLIPIAMGQSGLMTRILGPSFGAYLTYGALDDENRTAPGQLGARQLRDLYRIERLDRQALITGLLGAPIAHSFSPQLHNAAFRALDQNAVYIPFEVQDVGSFIRRMVHPRTREIDWNLRGLSVTAPHKTAIIEYLDSVEPLAREIGAVNTVTIDDEGLHGSNTDVAAFVQTLKERLGALGGLRLAVIGAGGAARGAVWGLSHEGARVSLFARDAESAQKLAAKFGSAFAPLEGASFKGFDAVINTTPLGTHGLHEKETPAEASQLSGARLAYDLVYNPAETPFLREARRAGCETMNGLMMLVRQAAEQFHRWTETPSPIELMREAAEEALGESQSAAGDSGASEG